MIAITEVYLGSWTGPDHSWCEYTCGLSIPLPSETGAGQARFRLARGDGIQGRGDVITGMEHSDDKVVDLGVLNERNVEESMSIEQSVIDIETGTSNKCGLASPVWLWPITVEEARPSVTLRSSTTSGIIPISEMSRLALDDLGPENKKRKGQAKRGGYCSCTSTKKRKRKT